MSGDRIVIASPRGHDGGFDRQPRPGKGGSVHVAGKHCYWLGHSPPVDAVARVTGPDLERGGRTTYYVCQSCLDIWREAGQLDREDVEVVML